MPTQQTANFVCLQGVASSNNGLIRGGSPPNKLRFKWAEGQVPRGATQQTTQIYPRGIDHCQGLRYINQCFNCISVFFHSTSFIPEQTQRNNALPIH